MGKRLHVWTTWDGNKSSEVYASIMDTYYLERKVFWPIIGNHDYIDGNMIWDSEEYFSTSVINFQLSIVEDIIQFVKPLNGKVWLWGKIGGIFRGDDKEVQDYEDYIPDVWRKYLDFGGEIKAPAYWVILESIGIIGNPEIAKSVFPVRAVGKEFKRIMPNSQRFGSIGRPDPAFCELLGYSVSDLVVSDAKDYIFKKEDDVRIIKYKGKLSLICANKSGGIGHIHTMIQHMRQHFDISEDRQLIVQGQRLRINDIGLNEIGVSEICDDVIGGKAMSKIKLRICRLEKLIANRGDVSDGNYNKAVNELNGLKKYLRGNTYKGKSVKITNSFSRNYKTISNAIHRGIATIAEYDSDLGVHLDQYIKLGKDMVYNPVDDIVWDT